MNRLEEIKKHVGPCHEEWAYYADVKWLITVAEAGSELYEWIHDLELPKGVSERVRKMRKALGDAETR